MNSSSNLLVLGVTGQVGQLVARNLKRRNAQFSVATRRKAHLEELAAHFGASRFIDLDDPRTFDEALKDITGLFLISGYTVDMLVQSKSLIDAAKRNGVNHIAHLGAFTRDHDAYSRVFAWHQMIEAYLRASGVAWTNLHPNMFMQNFLSVWSIKGGVYNAYTSKAVGFTALEDVAEAAAVILMGGPEKHNGKDYWFSADVLTPRQVADTLTAATGRQFTAAVQNAGGFTNHAVQPGSAFETAYAKGGFELFEQVEHGRMAYVGSVIDDTKKLLDREPLLLRDWAQIHAHELLECADKGESMNIGVIGTGDIGEVIIRRLRDAGYPVKMANSRGPESLRGLAAKTGAIPVSVEQAVQDVDILFIVVPEKAIPGLPKGLLNKARKETIVVDVGNYYPFRDGRIDELENGLTESVWVERQIGRPVVKVLNTIIARALAEAGRPAGSRERVALPISGDSPEAKEIVAQLIDRIGFDPVDAGTIAESWRQQPGSPVYCTNPTKEQLELWLKNVDRSSLATGREKGLKAYLAVVDADYQTQVKAHRSVLVKEYNSK